MGFATGWLEKKALFPRFIADPPDDQTGIIVVVPAYKEPRIEDLLDSLAACDDPGCKTEIIIVVNAPSGSGDEVKKNNEACIKSIESWKKRNKSFFRLFYIDAGEPGIKGWGVGLARKTGMDEALRRFSVINEPEGVIACLDADCTVSVNYLTALHENLYKSKKLSGCSVYFEHPLEGKGFSENTYDSISQYELHLRYYLLVLKYCRFPAAFHTVGSSMAVKALAYMKSGGMNRRRAGEDFYFIQKVSSAGNYMALNTTAVYPSPRESDRVPFGTGAAMNRLMSTTEREYMTYNSDAFTELKKLFASVELIYSGSSRDFSSFYDSLPAGLRSFMRKEEFTSSIREIKGNTAGIESFAKRFFQRFNMFMIMKYLNHVHEISFKKMPVTVEAAKMLDLSGIKVNSTETREILEIYRKMERGINYSSSKFFCPPAE
jgi:hypothetical protein